MNESWHTYKWVRSHVWKHHVIYMSELCHTYGWVISQMSESCHVWMSHVTQQRARIQCNATHCNTLRHAATRCNTLQHIATQCYTLAHTATHCNTLQLTAAHCNTLVHFATHCHTLQHTCESWHASYSTYTLQHTAAHCKMLQQSATHCNTPPKNGGIALDKPQTARLRDCLYLSRARNTPSSWGRHTLQHMFEWLLVPYQQSGYSTNNLATVLTILQNRLYSHCWYWKVSLQIIYNLVYPLQPDARHEYRTRWSMGSKKKESERVWGAVGT